MPHSTSERVSPVVRAQSAREEHETTMETPRHWQQMLLLVASLQEAWDLREDFYVAGKVPLRLYENQFSDDLPDPDVIVVTGTGRHDRRAWIVSNEGKPPDLVVELVSESS